MIRNIDFNHKFCYQHLNIDIDTNFLNNIDNEKKVIDDLDNNRHSFNENNALDHNYYIN